jgi:hypothetical protein
MPAWPAYLLLFAAIPLLLPTLARRLGERLRAPASTPIASRWLIATAVVTVLLPATAIAVSTPIESPTSALTQDDAGNFILTSVDESVQLRVERGPDGNRLTWDEDPWRAEVFYRVYRADGEDVECEHTDGHPAVSCYFIGGLLETVREPEFVDADAPPTATYRVGVGTNWIDDPAFGDVFAFSPPAAASG